MSSCRYFWGTLTLGCVVARLPLATKLPGIAIVARIRAESCSDLLFALMHTRSR